MFTSSTTINPSVRNCLLHNYADVEFCQVARPNDGSQ